MKKRWLILILLLLLVPTSVSDRPQVVFNSLNIEGLYEEFDNNDSVTVKYEGIQVHVENHFTKIFLQIKEQQGRDVTLVLYISKEYISPTEIGIIQVPSEKQLYMYVYENYTRFEYPLDAYETININISKAEIFIGKVVKSWHDLLGVKTFWLEEKENQEQVIVEFPKDTVGTEVDMRTVDVLYKSDWKPFWCGEDTESWWSYYPASDSLNDEVSYYMKDFGDKYQVVVNFKNGTSSTLHVYAYDDSIKGKIGKAVTKVGIQLRQFFIDKFGD